MLTTSARLALASVAAASLVTLASAPAQAYDHLLWGDNFLANTPNTALNPNANNWSAACNVDWTTYVANTQAACFFGLMLRKAQGYVDQDMMNHFGMNMPSSNQYYTKTISNSPYLLRITNIQDVQVGDLVFFAKTDTYAGHTAIVTAAAVEIAHTICPAYANTRQWKVEMMDSTSTSHGCADDRFTGQCYPFVAGTDPGIGEGNMRFYTTADPGVLKGHTWSVTSNCVMPSQVYFGEVTRPYAFGRLQNLLAPVGNPPPPPPPPPVSE